MAHIDADSSSTGAAPSTAPQNHEPDMGSVHATKHAADVALDHFGRHFATSTQPMVLFGPDFRMLAANEAVQRLTGHDFAASWVGRNIGDDFLTFADPDGVVTSVIALFEGRCEQFDFECELTTPDGHHKYLRIAIEGLRAADGSITYMAGFASDVTDLRRAESKLARQLQFETVLNETNNALLKAENGSDVAEIINAGTVALARLASAKRAFVWKIDDDGDATMPLDWCAQRAQPVSITERSIRKDRVRDALPAMAETGVTTVAGVDVPGLATIEGADRLMAIVAPVCVGERDSEQLVAMIGMVFDATAPGDDTGIASAHLADLALIFTRTRKSLERRRLADVRAEYAKFVNHVGAQFLTPGDADQDKRIERALGDLGSMIGAHHVQLRTIDWESMVSTVSVEYCDRSTGSTFSMLDDFATIDLNDPGMRDIASRTVPNQFPMGDYNFDPSLDDATVVLSVPLVVDDVVTATINAVAIGHGQFSADQIWMVHSIAGLITQLQLRQAAEEELRHRLELDHMVRTIAIDFNELTSDTIAGGLQRALRRIGETLRVDRAALCRLNQQARTILLAEEWVKDPRRAVPASDRLVSGDDSATVTMLLKSTIPIFRTPDSIASSLAKMMPQGVQVVHIPLVRGGVPVLSINFEADAGRVWTDAELGAIRSISALVVQLDARVEAERSVLRRLELEDLTRAIATDFLDLGNNSRGAGLDLALARLGPGIGVNVISLWRVDNSASTCTLRNIWGTEVAEPTDRVLDTRDDPALANLTNGNGASVEIVALGTLPITRCPPGPGSAAYASLRDAAGVVRGLIGFERVEQEPFSNEELGAIETVASMLVQVDARLEAEEYFTSAFDNAPVGVTMRDERGRLLACNRAYEAFIGATQEQLLADVDDSLGPRSTTEREASLVDGASDEIAFRRVDDNVVWAKVSTTHVRQPDGQTKLILSHVEDTTERRHAVEQLEYQASHDELTGLANRRVFLDELKSCLSEPPQPDQAAVLLLDLDRFKVANDSLGHSAGDDILRTIANRLRFAVRPGDVVARLGGDEFVVLLRGPVDELETTTVAERLLSLISKPIETGGGEVQTSCSVGVAFPSPADESIEDVLRHADAAMYQAKSRGRDRFVVFNQEHREALAQKVRLERQLRIAIDEQSLILFYQPEIELASGRILGAEGLIRWQHPEFGLLTAGAFIELAEESGLIVDLGRFVLDRVCRQGAEWNAAFSHPFVVRANVSARQLERTELVGEVKAALREANLPPEQLCLEITETALMRNIEDSLRILGALKDIGVQLAIDDFGTGFSSLAYLKRFPVDVLKIDQAFVCGLGSDPDDEAIVRSVLSMAKALDLDVVAEGIETEQQRQMLVDMGCQRGQGFGLVRPAPPAELTDQLRRGAIDLGVAASA